MLLQVAFRTRFGFTMNQSEITPPPHPLDFLEQYRYKVRTPLEDSVMLARLRLMKAASLSSASSKREVTYSTLVNEKEMVKLPRTDELTGKGEDLMETEQDAKKARKFVKPGSVQYSAYEVDLEMNKIMKHVVTTYPKSCSESVYQKAVLREAYLAGLPVMVERDVFSDYGNGSLLMGRVDMEVAGVCLYELKVGKPNIEVHALQLQKYLQAYDQNKENIQVAKLVYFVANRLVMHVMRDATPDFVV
jgi:hypothetical protein